MVTDNICGKKLQYFHWSNMLVFRQQDFADLRLIPSVGLYLAHENLA